VDLEVQSGGGAYAPGERHAAVSAAPGPASPGRLVVFFTGAAGDERRFVEDEYAPLTAALAAAGFPVISAEFGGGYAWGNDLALDRIGRLWRFGVDALGARGDGLLGVGVSKGATALLNYAARRPADVAGVAALIPAVDLAAAHDRDPRIGLEIEAAHGGPDGYRRAAETHNPAAAAERLAVVPLRLWISDDDPAIPPAEVEAFAARCGAELTRIGGGAGHSIRGLDPAEVTGFFAALP
jgi:hypothetical protein